MKVQTVKARGFVVALVNDQGKLPRGERWIHRGYVRAEKELARREATEPEYAARWPAAPRRSWRIYALVEFDKSVDAWWSVNARAATDTDQTQEQP